MSTSLANWRKFVATPSAPSFFRNLTATCTVKRSHEQVLGCDLMRRAQHRTAVQVHVHVPNSMHMLEVACSADELCSQNHGMMRLSLTSITSSSNALYTCARIQIRLELQLAT